MTPFTRVTGPAAPLMAENVNTDVIVRIERLSALSAEELGPYAFEPWRYREDGSEDPGFVLNRAPWRGAPILLAGRNFGCGSSREGAVWALNAVGVRVVIAPSFGAIFANNCYQNGTLPVTLPAETVEALAEAARARPDAPFTVDLETQRIVPPGGAAVPFEIDALRRRALLAGLDDIGLTVQRLGDIRAFQQADRARRPWAYALEQTAPTGGDR